MENTTCKYCGKNYDALKQKSVSHISDLLDCKEKYDTLKKRNDELVDELTTALNALLEICELFPNNLLYEKKIKLFKG